MVFETVIIQEGPQLIPIWFYLASSIAYGTAALISYLICYFAFRLYQKSKSKLNLIPLFGFLSLAVGFTTLLFASLYTYNYPDLFKPLGNINQVNGQAFPIYYAASLIGYFILLMIYLPKNLKDKFYVVYFPLWYMDLFSYHLVSLAIVGYILLKNVRAGKRTFERGLVIAAFAGIFLFHLLQLTLPFSPTLYLIAHGILAGGFLSFLWMLIRVSRR
ncbi:MAG: hypothetical protein J4452_00015 [Candidatus Aenigmarchaeota archaeon]|nr:hypothetical protein [Candidatus Aenigmarchaeota archaeon]